MGNYDHYNNREFSWLAFNRRVLYQAKDKRHPLLERLRFLSIFTSNLDEFVMKRVGGLKRQMESGFQVLSIDGLTPEEQLKKIREIIQEDIIEKYKIFKNIHKELKLNGIQLVEWNDLEQKEKINLRKFFKSNIFPILTPLSVDPGHPFPFISNLSTSLGVALKYPKGEEETFFSRIKIPDFIPRWVKAPSSSEADQKFISILQILKNNLDLLFPGMDVVGTLSFRLIRNADLEKDDEDAEDLLEMVSEVVKERKFAEPVQLECLEKPDPWILNFLKEELELTSNDVYEVKSPIDFTSLKPIIELNLPKLKFPTWVPKTPLAFLNVNSLFEVISKEDVLVHHPYESFKSSVERFIKEAAEDPRVRAIKMTLYRTGDQSPIVDALIRAAEQGKQVACLVELKARFDEQRNIVWAGKLEQAGVHVVYGIVGFKTHSKLSLVIREEAGKNQLYAHVGTGNYHSVTANIYTDFGLFTKNKEITTEIVELFNFLTGRNLKKNYKQLLVSPFNMREKFIQLIDEEIALKKKGKKTKIIAKMNSLEDIQIIEKLYEASNAGVEIVLFVRGFCCLKAGVKNLSENIKVYSVVGRFLEHSRIFYFSKGEKDMEKGEFFIGSADWMYRNLSNRVEVIAPIQDERHKKMIAQNLKLMLKDTLSRWELKPAGDYQLVDAAKELPESTHDLLMNFYKVVDTFSL
ncbi:MAG: polyphosphate kinase 1 [Halobacteriovoraceae bacterium]|nr:polyphosphate kinase 1 [Halobacteriovoraceae bacterium]MCB9093604.1 polyphosphate kinase 1 [Halobacteriovoraceae bacterium]